MKKLIIFVSLFFSSYFTFSQGSTYYAAYVKKCVWDNYQEKFIWNEGNKTNLKIVLLDRMIRIYDQADSYYILKGEEKKNKQIEFEMSSWDANDESGRRVSVSLVNYFQSKEVVIMILYSDMGFAYTIENNRLSPLNN